VQTQTDELERVAALLREHAAQLEIDPDSVWQPSAHALAAWRTCGGLLRIDLAVWSAAELIR
jgi:hypothetical protein